MNAGLVAVSRTVMLCFTALFGFSGSVGALAAGRRAERPAEPAACSAAIQAAERQHGIPDRLLHSIGLVESGRAGPSGRGAASWPWTINVAGAGRFFETKLAAISAVEQARGAGVHSIDVGCMQVNLVHHPAAFASLEQAFDPQANANYAAAFLSSLFRKTGNWPAAAEAYHSMTPSLGVPYGRRVMAIWPQAGRYGVVPQPQERVDDGRLERSLDPHNVYTPEFRARLASEAARRAERDAALNGLTPPRAVSLMLSNAAKGLSQPISRQGRSSADAAPRRSGRQPLRS